MTSDADNEDHKAGCYIVFDDKLGFSDEIKHWLESTAFDRLPHRVETFLASTTPEALTAEKKTKPDGSEYVLVREATDQEKRTWDSEEEGGDDDDE